MIKIKETAKVKYGDIKKSKNKANSAIKIARKLPAKLFASLREKILLINVL
ncbi:MAG: hypothetical protein WC323_00955 [Patescibacteria group bacterium]